MMAGEKAPFRASIDNGTVHSRQERVCICLLIASTVLTMMATDFYVPSLPSIAGEFHVDERATALTMSYNLLGILVGQAIAGPLSDFLGRWRVFYFGVAGFAMSSAICAMAASLEALIVFRAVQGVASLCGGAIALALINDLFDDIKRVRVMSLYGIAGSISPIIGPGIGGLFELFLSWRFGFVTLSICSAALIVIALIARPGEPAHGQSASFAGMFAAAKDLRTVIFALPCFWILSGVFAFLTAGPFIVVNSLNHSTFDFAILASVVAIGVLLGSYITGRMAYRRAPFLVCVWGVVALAAGGLLVVIGFHLEFGSSVTLFALGIGIFVFNLGEGMLLATLPTLALSHVEQNKGSAATIVSLSFLSGAICGAVVAPAGGLELGLQLMGYAALSGICILVGWRKFIAR